MVARLQVIKISDINVGTRFREDLGNIDELADGIKDKGVLQPITVDQDMNLLAGGRRIAAATKAGLTEIPCLIRESTGELDLRECELIENLHRKDFTWVEQTKLIAEIDRLQKAKDPNWSQNKTAKLLGHSHAMNVSRAIQLSEDLEAFPGLVKCKTQDEAIKMVKKAEEFLVTAELRKRQEQVQDKGLRDVLTLAKSNYHIGDALVELAALPAGAGNLHLIEVDPPYGIDLNEQKKSGGDKAKTYEEVERSSYPEFLSTIAKETYRIASKDCWMVFWYGPTHHQLVLSTLRLAGWQVDDIPGIWNKGHGQTMQPEVYLARSYEPFFICRKGQPALAKRGRNNVFDYSPVSAQKKYHPTERPVALIEEIIETFVGINSRILSPFLGSGATIRAAYNLGCSCWGYDLNPEYRDKFLLAVQDDTEKLNVTEEE